MTKNLIPSVCKYLRREVFTNFVNLALIICKNFEQQSKFSKLNPELHNVF